MDRDFKYFLDLPPHLDETADKEVLFWEQRQAWLARYWRRLELISETILQIGGAERTEPRLDLARLLWAGVPRPSMPLPQAFKDPGMLESGWLGPFAPDRAVATEDREWLRIAAIIIEGAMETGGEVRPFYRGILADCHALTGKPLLAARIWEEQRDEIIRDCMKDFMEFTKDHGPEVPQERLAAFGTVEVGLFIAGCLDESAGLGDREKAIRVLESMLEKSPASPQVHHKLGELLNKENRYSEVAQHFATERELTPESDVWRDPFADFASNAAFFKPQRCIKEYLQSVNAGAQKRLLRRTIEAHWPMFRYMTEACREKWVNGSYWLLGDHSSEDWSERERASLAGTELAGAAEWQLRHDLFTPFKEQLGDSLVSRATANKEGRLSDWCSFLLSDHYSLSLGNMRAILWMTHGTSEPLLRPFEDWLRRKFEDSWRKLNDRRWDVIAESRSRNLHAVSLEFSDAETLHFRCVQFLDALIRCVYINPAAPPSPGRQR
jgi:hypothetical protein